MRIFDDGYFDRPTKTLPCSLTVILYLTVYNLPGPAVYLTSPSFADLAENYKTSSSTTSTTDQAAPALSMLQTIHEVILGVRDTMDNAEQLRATLPRGISSL